MLMYGCFGTLNGFATACNESVIACNESVIACNESVIACNESVIACNESVIACNESVIAGDAEQKIGFKLLHVGSSNSIIGSGFLTQESDLRISGVYFGIIIKF